MSVKRLLVFVLASVAILFASCEKDAGEGGNSSITGYVHVTKYNATFVIVQGEFPASDEEVYIIYGDDLSYGERIRTSFDGKFEFKYLREGKYTVYTYTEDTTLSGRSVVAIPVEITDKKQTVDLGRIDIKKN